MIALRRYQDKKVAVLGLAKSGMAAVSALLAGGAEVVAWDDKESARNAFHAHFSDGKARLLAPAQWPWQELAALVPSPGIARRGAAAHSAIAEADAKSLPVLGDIELLCEAQPHARKIGITGTNGKSTTTSLIAHILQSAGHKPEVGGNLGTPALSLDVASEGGSYVLELSSYQLDLLHTSRINIALLLNITPDHIDRHGSLAGYVEAKSHIFDRQTKHDTAIVGLDDDYARSLFASLRTGSPAQLIGVSVRNELKRGVYVNKEGMLYDKIHEGEPTLMDIGGIAALTGRHNWQNAAFAYAACRVYGIAPQLIEKGMRSFPGLRHRMQLVSTIHGVRFINDSKATNADAASNALAPFNPIYWIAGGKAKEGGIASLVPYVPHLAHTFLIGEAEEQFAATLEGKTPYTRCGTLQRAFDAAAEMALAERRPGAVVLLSPACASFDQWKSFEERGDAFCTMTEQLLDIIVKGGRKKSHAF